MISRLFQPINIGPVSLPNRVVMTAMHLNYTPNGEVTDRFIEFYRARARGGAGFIIIGGADINDQASGMDFMLSIKDDRNLPGLKRFVDAIHAEGAKTAIQLYMAGAYSYCFLKGLPVLAPSAYSCSYNRAQTTAMTLDDIERVQSDFVQATRRAREAGFDAVEVIASAGYLICQFLSPKTNKREAWRPFAVFGRKPGRIWRWWFALQAMTLCRTVIPTRNLGFLRQQWQKRALIASMSPAGGTRAVFLRSPWTCPRPGTCTSLEGSRKASMCPWSRAIGSTIHL